jgi:ATP-dependent Clp protease ATP-binding subunit ClpC
MTAPPDLREFDEKIAEVRRQKEAAIDGQDFEKAARLRDDEKQLSLARNEREAQWKSGDMDVVAEVDEELIAEVLAASTGIPVFKLTEEESSRLLNMEVELHKRIVGMDDAIKALSQAIRRTRAGLKDPRRPGGSFIFAGPTGVGKTELAKTLAEFLFGDEDALIQLDMSEYSEKHTVSRLFGSPPGYVGYEEGGQLTEKVRRRPFSVVLFDEVEKAHPDIFNSLLQVLEDGRLTDSQGRMVDFKNTVIIMTTNLGTRDITKGSLGFSAGPDTRSEYERMKNKVTDELKNHFRPEFLNRVDDVIVFPQLTQDEIVAIVDLEIAKLDKRLRDKDMGLELTMAAKALLAKKGYDPVLGARPLRRTIQREIEDMLSERILYGELRSGEFVLVDATGDEKDSTFTFTGSLRKDTIPDIPDVPPIDEVGGPQDAQASASGT